MNCQKNILLNKFNNWNFKNNNNNNGIQRTSENKREKDVYAYLIKLH